MTSDMKKWKCKKSKIVFSEKYFKARKDEVELPNGEKRNWVYLDKTDSPSAMVIGLTKDKKVVMNRQYRYLVGKVVLELPAGYAEKGESLEKTARREFEEETGFKCEKLSKLGSVWETYGEFKHQIHVYFTKDFRKTKQKKEPDEDIEVEFVDLDRAVEMVLRNKIPDAVSALAILLLKEKISRGEIEV